MPRRSSLLQLPDDLRAALNRRLVAAGFAGYDDLTEWLGAELEQRDLEIRVSRSAIARHGKAFEEKLERMRIATEQAKAISEGADDDEGAMNEALIRLVQTKTFEVLRDLDDTADLNKIGVMIARLVRASVGQKKWAQEARAKAAAKLDALEQDVANGKGGLDPQALLRRVREDIYGIYD